MSSDTDGSVSKADIDTSICAMPGAQKKTIRDWQAESHGVSVSKGWWDKHPTLADKITTIPEKLCLIHSEVSEALEVYREKNFSLESKYEEDGKPISIDSELADVVIRVFDLCGALQIDLEKALEEKTAYNRKRAMMHGGKRC